MPKLNSTPMPRASEIENNFYEPFSDLFQKVFTPRANFSRETYVTVPQTEKKISDFIEDDSVSFTVFMGPAGSGKSTTMYNTHLTYSGGKEGKFFAQLIDFRREDSDLIPSKNGKYENGDLDGQSRAVIGKFIIGKIGTDRFGYDGIFCSSRFISYCAKWYYRYLPEEICQIDSAYFKKDKAYQKECVEIFRSKFLLADEHAFNVAGFALRYLVEVGEIERVLLIVDNTENARVDVVQSITRTLNQLVSTFRSSKLEARQINVILSCRRETFERLRRNELETLFGVQHIQPILHEDFAPLFSIVSKRSSLHIDNFQYLMNNGMRVSGINAKEAVSSFFAALNNSEVMQFLLRLNNFDISEALISIREICRNPNLPVDKFVEFLLTSQKDDGASLGWIKEMEALSFLLYGPFPAQNGAYYRGSNDGNYSKSVPNMLKWNYTEPTTLFVRLRMLRIIEFLASLQQRTSLVSVSEVVSRYRRYFPALENSLISELSEMNLDGLIIASENSISKNLNDYDSIRVSPKGKLLLDYSCDKGILFIAYCDDIDMPENFLQDLEPEHIGGVRYNLKCTASYIEFLWAIEKTQLEFVCESNQKDRYILECGGLVWSEVFCKVVVDRLQGMIWSEGRSSSGRSELLRTIHESLKEVLNEIEMFKRSKGWQDQISVDVLADLSPPREPFQDLVDQLAKACEPLREKDRAAWKHCMATIQELTDSARSNTNKEAQIQLLDRIFGVVQKAEVSTSLGRAVADIYGDLAAFIS